MKYRKCENHEKYCKNKSDVKNLLDFYLCKECYNLEQLKLVNKTFVKKNYLLSNKHFKDLQTSLNKLYAIKDVNKKVLEVFGSKSDFLKKKREVNNKINEKCKNKVILLEKKKNDIEELKKEYSIINFEDRKRFNSYIMNKITLKTIENILFYKRERKNIFEESLKKVNISINSLDYYEKKLFYYFIHDWIFINQASKKYSPDTLLNKIIFRRNKMNRIKNIIKDDNLERFQLYNDYINDGENKENEENLIKKLSDFIKRENALKKELNKNNLEFKSGSKICIQYIEGNLKKYTIKKIVEIMLEMNFLHKNTNYNKILNEKIINYRLNKDRDLLYLDKLTKEAKIEALQNLQ